MGNLPMPEGCQDGHGTLPRVLRLRTLGLIRRLVCIAQRYEARRCLPDGGCPSRAILKPTPHPVASG